MVGNLVPWSRSGKKVKNACRTRAESLFQTADLVHCSDRYRFAGLRTASELLEEMLAVVVLYAVRKYTIISVAQLLWICRQFLYLH